MSPARSSPIWRPFTQHALQKEVVLVQRTEGAWLETKDRRRILDAISSWWVITHGHRHPRIVQAVKDQIDELDQIIFAGYTHEAAEELARRLVRVAPPGLDHVFFSDSGSICVEVAIKMALGFWRNRGEPRARLIAMEHGYHGDTIGAMSAGARSAFNAAYEPLLFETTRVPFPARGREQATLDALERACKSRDAAAFIVEPLIAGAGGMLMYDKAALREMKRVCEAHGVLFIADEVMTGFGRTGTLFACEQAGVVPDIACYGKGLTGGSLPLAVTMCKAAIFDAHYSRDRTRAFFHSSSFTANPVACAAALANLEIWEKDDARERVARLAAMQEERLARFRDDGRFSNARRLGTITALDLRAKDSGYFAAVGPRLLEFFAARGVLLRPLGDTIYVLPPYCITEYELDAVYDAIDAAGASFAGI